MTTPECPQCGSAMKLRTARRGANAGGQFWGCTQYPRCKGTRPYEGADTPESNDQAGDIAQAPPPASQAAPVAPVAKPVSWSDGTPRPGWETLYASVGAVPAFLAAKLDAFSNKQVEKLLSDTVIFRNKTRASSVGGDSDSDFIVQIILKLLQRGLTPLPTVELEAATAKSLNLPHLTETSPESPEIGWKITGAMDKVTPQGLIGALTERKTTFQHEPSIEPSNSGMPGFDSERERAFASELLPDVNSELAHWLHAQVPFRQLVADDAELAAARRADFLISHPVWGDYVIEIDGDEHTQDFRIDTERDKALEDNGFQVIRISNHQIDDEATDSIREALSPIIDSDPRSPTPLEREVADAAFHCSIGSKVQYILCNALLDGALTPGAHWELNIAGADIHAHAAVADFSTLLESLDQIYGTSIAPASFNVQLGVPQEGSRSDLSICVQTDVGEKYTFPQDAELFDYILRPTFLPHALKLDMGYNSPRRYCVLAHDRDSDTEVLEKALVTFLQYLFRKRTFRQGQLQALINGLCGHDSIVLLPTGGGKSIIYQLTGLLQPGITLVVDPLVSLIEDQERILNSYGIERVLGITSGSFSQRDERRRMLDAIKEAQYHFIMISPERLQTPEFRDALRSLTSHTLVNSAVIDEAHCVSEWGHDFRPAYLNLARNLREFCKDKWGAPPALFALTGTASRAVLRDMLVDLGVDPDNSNAIVRPTGFDRKELEFDLITCKPKEVIPTLEGVLASLPKRFRISPSDFSQNRGDDTLSGIVFCPTVKGKTGVKDIQSVVSRKLGAPVAIYSGSSPAGVAANWDLKKRENARAFIENEVPAIVSTKAFGMGIDKPNVRYTVHVGMPGSLEAYYQEAGRAGRDQKRAICIAIYSEADEERTRRILSSSVSNDQVDSILKEEPWNARSDANTAMFFHRNGYPGVEEEVSWVVDLLAELGEVDHKQSIVVSREDNKGAKSKEKAIFRLLQIGMISDYTVDYGAGKYDLEIAPFDPEISKAAVLDYIRRSQPGRAKADEEALSSLNLRSDRDSIINIVRYLINFAYDVIEQSRRRAISESFEAARIGSRDQDAFRKRLLEYLEEGAGSDFIERLLSEESVDLDDWVSLILQINNAAEAGEFRGIAIRYLESYPEHPGLLLIRAIAESMSGDCDERRVREDLESALQFGTSVYGLKQREVRTLANKLLNFSLERSPRLAAPLIMAFDGQEASIGAQELQQLISRLITEYPERTIDIRATLSIRNIKNQLTGINDALNEASSMLEIG